MQPHHRGDFLSGFPLVTLLQLFYGTLQKSNDPSYAKPHDLQEGNKAEIAKLSAVPKPRWTPKSRSHPRWTAKPHCWIRGATSLR